MLESLKAKVQQDIDEAKQRIKESKSLIEFRNKKTIEIMEAKNRKLLDKISEDEKTVAMFEGDLATLTDLEAVMGEKKGKAKE